MNWSLREKMLIGGLTVSLLMLGWVNLIAPKNTTELVESADRAQSTYKVLGDLMDFYAAMNIAESGRRGYVFSGRTEELGRHQAAVLALKAELTQLQQSELSSTQKQEIQQLSQLTFQRLALFQQSIELYQRDRSTDAMQTQNNITSSSIQLREQIQTLLNEIKNIENQQLESSLTQMQSNIQYRTAIERLTGILGFAIACGVIFIFGWGQQRQHKLKLLEQTLIQEQELNSLKLRLFSMISHEFRTPLSVILTSTQLLAEILKPDIEQSQLKNIDRIHTSAKLMNRLLVDFLTLTRAESGNLDCQPEWIDIEAFCLNLLDDIQASSPSENSLHFTSQGQCRRSYLDEKLLYSILSNLLLNAVKYSPAGSEVWLKLHCELEQIIFEVEDQGIGILRSDQENVYTPFYRGQNVEKIVGSGLGLAVVKKCLELLHGSIHFESKTTSGTRFIITIPRPHRCDDTPEIQP